MITNKQIDIIHDAAIHCMKAATLTEQESIIEDALEEYEQNKWVKFDYRDKSTWPENGDNVIVTIDPDFLEEIGCENKTYFADFNVRGDYCDFEVYYCDEASGHYAITHWQPMPEPRR